MRVLVWAILIVFFGAAPLLFSLWLLFPVFAGIGLVVLFFSLVFDRGPKWLRGLLNPLIGIFLAVFVIWLLVKPFKNPPAASVMASPIGRLLTGTAATGEEKNDEMALQRRTLDREVAVKRFEIQRVASAIDVLRSAESVFAGLSTKGKPDTANLGPALEDVRTTLASAHPKDAAGNLLDPGVLSGVVKSLGEDIQQVETKQNDPAITKSQLIELQDQLPGLLDRHSVFLLPTKIVRLENAVRQTLDAKVDSATTFLARYARDQDTLSYEQETVLRFNGTQARSLDLSNFFPGAHRDMRETVTLAQNGTAPIEVLQDAPIKQLALDTAFAIVRRSIKRSGASHPILNGRYFLSFRAIEIHWPTSSFPAIVTNIRLPENPDRTWPWTVDTGAGSSFQGVEIPRYSFIFSTPPGTAADQTHSTLLAFPDGKLTPQSLATNAHISVELLPAWLSFDKIQKNKDYLITENAAFALLVAAFSGIATFIVELATKDNKPHRSSL